MTRGAGNPYGLLLSEARGFGGGVDGIGGTREGDEDDDGDCSADEGGREVCSEEDGGVDEGDRM